MSSQPAAAGGAGAGEAAAAAAGAGLANFNVRGGEAARRALMTCCSSDRWARAVLAGRPYADAAALLRQSDRAVGELAASDLRDALAGHPRIGADPAAAGGWSRAEQGGLDGAAESTRRALADGNAAYERRFGHIYLVCATGRSGGELLRLLQARLAHDDETEWRVVRSELKKINRIRLVKLIGAAA